MGWGYYGGFAPYVSKAKKIRRTATENAKLTKKRTVFESVVLDSRAIAQT